ncbi:hypothetical protein GGR56DRAFT_611682 [Xylariaceae sp. FL0804]|nr:hypothetical protein GGR56DRAFT_611682 [Xylariaceae sp. FL0804]
MPYVSPLKAYCNVFLLQLFPLLAHLSPRPGLVGPAAVLFSPHVVVEGSQLLGDPGPRLVVRPLGRLHPLLGQALAPPSRLLLRRAEGGQLLRRPDPAVHHVHRRLPPRRDAVSLPRRLRVVRDEGAVLGEHRPGREELARHLHPDHGGLRRDAARGGGGGGGVCRSGRT